jgi:hypothetical protein
LQGLNETLPSTGRTASIALLEQWPGVRAAHYLLFEPSQTTGVAGLKLTNVVQRFVCGVLVAHLPDEALPELWETLSEMYAHYVTSTSVNAALPSTKSQARRGKTNAAPKIRLEE